MRNLYIVVAPDERTERKYAKIIKNKLEELGLAQFYSLPLTSARIKAVFYSVGEEYFWEFLRNEAEFGPRCHFHILVFSENEQHFDVLGDEADRIINSVVRTFGSWSNRFNIRFFSVFKRDKCPLYERFKQYRPSYYDIESDGTESKKFLTLKKALMLYVGSVETIIPPEVDDDQKIQENKSIIHEWDRIPDIADSCESKGNHTGIDPEPKKDIFTSNTFWGGEKMATKEIIILSASSANTYMVNIRSSLQDILTRRGGSGEYYVRSWATPGTMRTGGGTLPNLVKKGRDIRMNGGFALCLFTPDDPCTIRGEKVFVSRDNVWLEYGLFSGLLGLDRVFVLCPHPGGIIQKKEENGSEGLETRRWHCPTDFNLQWYEYEYTGDYESDQHIIKDCISNIADEIIEKSLPPSGTGSVRRMQSLDGGRKQSPDYGFKSKL